MNKFLDEKNLLIIVTVILIIIAVLNFLPPSLLLNFISIFTPSKTTTVAKPTPTNTISFTPPAELAKKAEKVGYKILWIDSSDPTGRTMLFSAITGTSISTLVRNIGIQTFKNPQTQAPISTNIVGVFDKPIRLSNSKDHYIVIKDPRTNLPITRVRIMIGGDITTKLYVDSLALDKDGRLKTESLGDFNNIVLLQHLPQILKENDALVVKAARTEKNADMRDKDGYLVALSLTVHRFDGKDEIFKETGLKESDLAPKNK